MEQAYKRRNMKMSYTVLGTNNMDAAIKFYDALFEGIGTSIFQN